jgi:hypothetical protein
VGGGHTKLGVGTLVVVIGVAAAGCGSSSHSRVARTPAGTTTKGCGANCANGGAVGAPNPNAAGSSASVLGCHQYCKQAGGYGGGGGPSTPAMKILTSGTVAVAANGSVPIRLQCKLSTPCQGALLIDVGSACAATHGPTTQDRSDLAVDAGATRTIAVPLSSCTLSLVRRRGQVPAGVTADSGASPACRRQSQIDCVNGASLVLRSAS